MCGRFKKPLALFKISIWLLTCIFLAGCRIDENSVSESQQADSLTEETNPNTNTANNNETIVPTIPTGLSASASNSAVTLSWTANSESHISGYKIYRSSSQNGNYSLQNNSTLVSATTYQQSGLTNGTTYWYKISAVNSDGLESALTAAVSAKPAAVTYVITSSAGSGGSISPSGSTSVAAGSSKVFTVSANSGYQIASVKVDGVNIGTVSTYTFSNLNSAHSISATFAVVQVQTYTLTASAGAGGNILPSGSVSVNSGTSKSFLITPNPGYQIGNISVDGNVVGPTGSYTFSNITGNHAIAATFVVDSSSAQGWPSPTVTLAANFTYTSLQNAAVAGAVVAIPPGTYTNFRVLLSGTGTASKPIVIRAADPANPPVFDYQSTSAENLQGTPTGDEKRFCWEATGSYITVMGIIIRNCHGADGNAAGFRSLYSDHLNLRYMLLDNSEMNFFGGGNYTTIEFSELRYGGNDGYTHNVYVGGGDNLTIRYSYIHDPGRRNLSTGKLYNEGGQNIHMRARHSTIEYNWIARAYSYEFDLMPPGTNYDPDGLTDKANMYMLMRGNVLVTSPTPGNAKLFTLFNDTGTSVGMNLTMLWNTIYFSQTSTSMALIQATNNPSKVVLSNNIVTGDITSLFASGTSQNVASGKNNVFPINMPVGPFTNSMFDSNPFVNAAASDFTLNPTTVARTGADTSIGNAPVKEYYQNETNKLKYRNRTAVGSVGAFDITTTGSGMTE